MGMERSLCSGHFMAGSSSRGWFNTVRFHGWAERVPFLDVTLRVYQGSSNEQ